LRRTLSQRAALWGLAALAAALLLACFTLLPPIQQSEQYHRFADHRSWLGIPNTLDTLSNLGFLWVGAVGLWRLRGAGIGPGSAFSHPWERRAFAVVFAATALVAVGSSYYHLAPSTARLFWDRLPMTVVFMALLGITVAERVDLAAGRRLFWPLLLGGLGSAVLWRQSGDLRLYGFVQFFSLLALPLLLALRPPRYTRAHDLWWMAGLYAAAKLAEHADVAIYSRGDLVSGHTLKHLLAAAAVGRLLPHLRRRHAVYR
jgi:hypothetical protein